MNKLTMFLLVALTIAVVPTLNAGAQTSSGASDVSAQSNTPTNSHLRSTADPPLYICSGIVGEASAQDSAKNVLSALQHAFANQFASRLAFDPESFDGDCPDRDKAILELTYGRLRTRDDNYVIFERHFEGVDIAAVLRRPKGEVVNEFPGAPANATRGAWVAFGTSRNQVAILGVTGAVLVANARNTDKTTAAGVSVLSNFSSLKFPTYHQVDVQYQTLQTAVLTTTCALLTGSVPKQILPSLKATCPAFLTP